MWPYTATSAEGLAIAKTVKFHIDKHKREERERKEASAMGRKDTCSQKVERIAKAKARAAAAAAARAEAAAARAAEKKKKADAQAAKLARQPREKQVQALARKLANVSKLPEDKLDELIALMSG